MFFMKVVFKKRRRLSPQERLIKKIYDSRGGLYAVAKLLDVSPQLALGWKKQGYIPLQRVQIVAQKLSVTPYALNFKQYTSFTGKEVPWEEVENRWQSCSLC